MKSKFKILLLTTIFISCSGNIQFVDKFPDRPYLEINFCQYEETFSVTDLTISVKEINRLNSKNFNKDEINIFYLDPKFNPNEYDFAWLNLFSSKSDFIRFDNLLQNNKKYKNWGKTFKKVSNCNTDKQYFYKLYNNNFLDLEGGKVLKNYSFCKYLPSSDLNKIVDFFYKNYEGYTSNISILIPEIINTQFDFVLEESSIEIEEYISIVSQIGFVADCNLDLPEKYNDGLYYDGYLLKNN